MKSQDANEWLQQDAMSDVTSMVNLIHIKILDMTEVMKDKRRRRSGQDRQYYGGECWVILMVHVMVRLSGSTQFRTNLELMRVIQWD